MATDNTPHSGARLRNAQARVEVAERRADFERQLRHEAEQERDRLLGTQEELRQQLEAGTEGAERVAELESQTRQLEQERHKLLGTQEELRHLVKAGSEVAERVAERESQKRQNLEQELDRLRSVLEDEQSRKSWWRR